jgi:hypothetical protein
MRIVVAGGTGVVGRHVVAAVVAEGHELVVLARSCGVNVVTGQCLARVSKDLEAPPGFPQVGKTGPHLDLVNTRL